MDKKNLIVQLFAPTEGSKGRIGTAYPVAPNVLMTAAHVIGDAAGDAVQARWWHLAKTEDDWKKCTTILWDGRKFSPACDVVLLRCEFPAAASGRYGQLSAMRPKDHVPWASEGFPFVGERGTRPVPVQGTTHSMGDRSEHFDLAVTAGADTEEGWKGASGSPVFVQEAIIGVIVNSPLHYRAERFEAVPVFKLLENEDFRRHVRYSESEDERQQLARAGIEELSKSKTAMERLSKVLSIGALSEPKTWAQVIVDKLLADTNPVEISAQIVEAIRQVESSGQAHQETLACLHAVAMYLIPASLAAEHVPQLRVVADDDQHRYEFHAKTKTFVEFGMARLHGRAASYCTPRSERDEPPGILSLEKPVEAGIDKDGQQFKRDFVAGLRDAMVLYKWSESDLLSDDGFQAAVDEIKYELELRVRFKEGLHYYVFHLPKNADQRQRRERIIGELDKLFFPHIRFIGIESGKRSQEEQQSVRLLLRILCGAAGIKWRTDGQDQTLDRPRQTD